MHPLETPNNDSDIPDCGTPHSLLHYKLIYSYVMSTMSQMSLLNQIRPSRVHWSAFLLLLTLSLVFLINEPQASEESLLQAATDLSADGTIAERQSRLMVILVSQEHCEFCEQIKEEVLNPMIRSGEHKKDILIRELFIDFDITLKDFSGKQRSGTDIAQDYGISFTPTMLFLDPQGKLLVEPMVGLNTPDLYPFYLDRSIKQAITVQQQNAKM